MYEELSGVNVAVLGGDERELELIKSLAALGANLKVIGYSSRKELANIYVVADDLAEAIEGVDVIIAPMAGTDEKGVIRAPYANEKLVLTEEIMQTIPAHTPFFIGVARPFLKAWAAKYQIKIIQLAAIEEIALLNAIPTAEGAIQIAMEELPITIHGSSSIVLGYGRVGSALAKMLVGIGANVVAFANNPVEVARAKVMGINTLPLGKLIEFAHQADIVFNTIPALVLTRSILQTMKQESVIIDLATAPGGTDFTAASSLGLNAKLAPGLPGKVAPKTAGRILASVVPKLIKQELGRGG